jgi:ATP-dependent DNA helicase RecG
VASFLVRPSPYSPIFSSVFGQYCSIADINADLSSNHPMLRLLQGDVGSGKTIVAVFACLTICA